MLDECLSNAAAIMQTDDQSGAQRVSGAAKHEIGTQGWPVSIAQESVSSNNRPGSVILG